MNKAKFKKLIKEMVNDIDRGLYGYQELFDELWYYLNNEQMRNKDLWKEIKRLRRKYEPEKKS